VKRLCVALAAMLLGWTAFALSAPPARSAPTPIEGVGFAPQTGATLPEDARYVDEHNVPVRFSDYLHRRPLLIVPAYYECPLLCSVVLDGIAAALARAYLEPGRDVEVVVFSIAASETPVMALRKKRAVLREPDAPDAEGWHFLTGDQAAIDAMTAALNYRYRYHSGQQEYAHASGIVVATPSGLIVQTLFGVSFPADELRRVVMSADADSNDVPRTSAPGPSRSSAADWLLCFRYDPRVGRYTFVAMNAVRVIALLSALVLLAFWILPRRSSRRRRHGVSH
jgi:protein SCO1/2